MGTLRILFKLNRGSGQRSVDVKPLERGIKGFISTIVQDVGVEYAKGSYDDLKSKISTNIKFLIEKELVHLTGQYRQFIIGRERAGRGTITTSVQGPDAADRGRVFGRAATVPLSRALPTWAPRKENYLRRKGHRRWFEYSRYLGQISTAESWQDWFGPINITVRPSRNTNPQKVVYKNGKATFGVANIYVRVFGQITPAMLTALTTGNISAAEQTQDGRKSGLLGLVAQDNQEAAYRLGANPKYTPYRPTLEPFLAFAITRSVPEAVFKRLSAEGYGRSVGSAGRTR